MWLTTISCEGEAERSPQEAATFMETRVPFEVWDRIGGLDQKVRLHYIQPERCELPCVLPPK